MKLGSAISAKDWSKNEASKVEMNALVHAALCDDAPTVGDKPSRDDV